VASFLKRQASKGYYKDLSVQWLPGQYPTAIFYDENGQKIKSAKIGNLKQNEIEDFFWGYNFPLRHQDYESAVALGTFEGHDYELYKSPNPFRFATKFAKDRKKEDSSGYIVEISSPEEQLFVEKILSENGVQSAWLGASDLFDEGNFIWLGGDLTGQSLSDSFQNWKRGEPNNAGDEERCVVIDQEGGWNDVNCGEIHTLLIEFSSSQPSDCASDS